MSETSFPTDVDQESRPDVTGQSSLSIARPTSTAPLLSAEAAARAPTASTPMPLARKRQASTAFILSSPQYVSAKRVSSRRAAEVDSESDDEDDQSDDADHTITLAGATTMEERVVSEARERERLLREHDEIQDSIELLRDTHAQLLEANASEAEITADKEDSAKAKAQSADGEEAEDIEALESMLREMDDGTLSALLTQSGNDKNPAFDTLMQYLPKDRPATVQAPARSAGVEGTGTAFDLDEQQKRLEKSKAADLDIHIEETLQSRLERSTELRKALATFTGLTLRKIESRDPRPLRKGGIGRSKRQLRYVVMRGQLEDDLGAINFDMNVEDQIHAKKRDLPQIVTLDLETDDAVFYALGEEQIKEYVENVNIPAILLAIRTMIPLAKTRYQLFSALALQYRELSGNNRMQWQAEGIRVGAAENDADGYPRLSQLVNPKLLQRLTLRRTNGVRLEVDFRIVFNRWGHAKPSLTIKPHIPDHVLKAIDHDEQAHVQTMLEEMPSRFEHLCAHRPAHLDTRTVLTALIDSFFHV